MRARNIKPGFFKSDELAELAPITRILFAGLWCIADREGRLEDRPKRIKADVLPYDDCDVDTMLTELADVGFIVRYCDGEVRYIAVANFSKHQNPHKNESESVIPPPDSEQHRTSTVQVPELHSTNPADSLIPDSLIPDTGFLESDGACAPDAALECVEVSDCERRVAGLIRQVRGMASVDDCVVALHLREVIASLDSPVTEKALLTDALRFRDYWNDKRSNQPSNQRWRGWRSAMTNWFTRTGTFPQSHGRASPPKDNVAAGMSAVDEFSDLVRKAAPHETRRIRAVDAPADRALPPAANQR